MKLKVGDIIKWVSDDKYVRGRRLEVTAIHELVIHVKALDYVSSYSIEWDTPQEMELAHKNDFIIENRKVELPVYQGSLSQYDSPYIKSSLKFS